MKKIGILLLISSFTLGKLVAQRVSEHVQKEYKIALILPFDTRKGRTKVSEVMLDYYAGFKIAINNAAADGLKCRLYVFDNKKDSGAIGTILKHPDMGKMDIIVGPVYDADVEYVNAFCDSTKQIFVNPLRYYNPGNSKHTIINFFPDDMVQIKSVINKVSTKFNSNYVYYVMADESASSKQLASWAHKVLKEKGLTVGKDLVFANSLIEGKIWKLDSVIIINTIKSKESNDAIETALETHLNSYGIAHFDFQKENKKYINYNHLLFPNMYYYNKMDSSTVKFNSIFKTQQNGASSKYGGIGYDQAHYISYSLLTYGTNFANLLPGATFTGIRTGIKLEPEGNNVITNMATYLYKQGKDYKTKYY